MEHDNMTRTRLFVGLETAENHATIAPEEVIGYIKQFVDAGTFYESLGLWKGETENSIVFEVMDFNSNSDIALSELKEGLEEEFSQDSVMIEETGVEVSF